MNNPGQALTAHDQATLLVAAQHIRMVAADLETAALGGIDRDEAAGALEFAVDAFFDARGALG